MSKYGIDKKGADAMLRLSSDILGSYNSIDQSTKNLKSTIKSYMDELGVYGDDIYALILQIESLLEYNKVALLKLAKKALENYELIIQEINKTASQGKCEISNEFNGSADVIRTSSNTSSVNPVYGNGEFTPLSKTAQTTQTVFLSGREVDVFDHPFEPNNYRICNQGSAYPSGPQGTCGCCACGTIINKSGGNTNENDIVAYAWDNKLCSNNGGTSPGSWVDILGGAGINSHEMYGRSLSELANYVEQGHGVIIAVSACTYNPQMYGHYFPGVADGHALVLESVIRDHNTGEILEYVVADSNGNSRDDACRRVPAGVLEKSFSRKNKISVVTNNVIW